MSAETATTADLTAEEEERVAAKPVKSPGDVRKLAAMAEWRRRQTAGDAEPAWGRWAEFAVTLKGGAVVRVLYDPSSAAFGGDQFDFHGPAVDESGHLWHPEGLRDGRRPALPLAEWARRFCERAAAKVRGRAAKGANA